MPCLYGGMPCLYGGMTCLYGGMPCLFHKTLPLNMTAVHLGLKENAAQFSLLVLINAFVGGMVGLKRSILPSLA